MSTYPFLFLAQPSAVAKEIGAYTKRRQHITYTKRRQHITFEIQSSHRAGETALARANRRAGLKYAPAMSFAEAPTNKQVTVNVPDPGLEAPFDCGAPINGDPTSIPNKKHARKARLSLTGRL